MQEGPAAMRELTEETRPEEDVDDSIMETIRSGLSESRGHCLIRREPICISQYQSKSESHSKGLIKTNKNLIITKKQEN